jgi:uncharacterized protein YoxC|nr:MAG TPA: Phi29 scaffolding protein [Caudoviricetes sp.]
MTIEELRAEVTKLTNENKKLNEDYNIIKTQLDEKEKTIENLNSSVSDLKQKNYDLFVQIGTQTKDSQKNEEPKEPAMSVADITYKLLGGR